MAGEGFLGMSGDMLLALAAQYLQKSSNPDGIKVMGPTKQEEEINKRKLDWIDNGSPTSRFVNDLATQQIQGLSSFQPNVQFRSNYMKGQSMPNFMPQIDFSRIASLGGGGLKPGAPASAPPPQEGKPGPMGEPLTPWGVHGDPFGSIGAPAGSQGDPFANFPTNAQGNSPGMNDIFGRGVQYLRDHPSLAGNLLKGGATALLTVLGVPALAGTAAGKMLASGFESWANRANDRDIVGTQTQRPLDILKPSDWQDVHDSNVVGTQIRRPIDILAPAGSQPSQPEPRPRENLSPGFANQRNSDYINQFWNNLQYGGGEVLGRIGRPGGLKGLR